VDCHRVHRPRCRSRGRVALQRVRPTVGRALHDTHKLHRESTLRFDASARADWWRPASAHLPHRFPTATTGCSRVLWDEAIRTLPAVWTCPCLNPSTPSSGQRRALWQYIFHGKLGRHRRGTVRTLLSDKNARICLASLTLIHVTKYLMLIRLFQQSTMAWGRSSRSEFVRSSAPLMRL
jgi:hypothetical protein